MIWRPCWRCLRNGGMQTPAVAALSIRPISVHVKRRSFRVNRRWPPVSIMFQFRSGILAGFLQDSCRILSRVGVEPFWSRVNWCLDFPWDSLRFSRIPRGNFRDSACDGRPGGETLGFPTGCLTNIHQIDASASIGTLTVIFLQDSPRFSWSSDKSSIFNQWDSQGFSGIPGDSWRFLKMFPNSMRLLMGFLEILWDSEWDSLRFFEILWDSLRFFEILWDSEWDSLRFFGLDGREPLGIDRLLQTGNESYPSSSSFSFSSSFSSSSSSTSSSSTSSSSYFKFQERIG